MTPAPIENPATQADYYTDLPVGEILRRTRVHYNQTLDDAANYLRIRASQLEALEKNDIAQLPGQVYAIGYIRTYSEYLGLDGEKMVYLFKQQSGAKPSKPELHFPVPASESKAPNLFIIFGSLAVLALVIGVWIALSAVGKSRDKTIAEIPSVPADMRGSPAAGPPAPAPIANTQTTPISAAALAAAGIGPATTVTAPAAAAPANAGTAPVAAPATQQYTTGQNPTATSPQIANAQPAATTPTTGAIPAAPATAEATSSPATTAPQTPATTAPAAVPTGPKKEIIITIKDRSWVEVRDKQGKPILSRILKPGEVFIVPEANYGLRLDTGNAGGIELKVNGQPYPPLGKEGDILRGFVLDGNKMVEKLPASAAR
ncbi:MAG: Transcriptional Regulator, family [Micavibrio sp.]|nr:Transcriptional Regulator, family [Micavibrio sp.]